MQAERQIKNKRIRKSMGENGIDQRKLSAILGITETEMSVIMKRELARSEQDLIIRAIKDWAES